jgi:hypothetical protein
LCRIAIKIVVGRRCRVVEMEEHNQLSKIWLGLGKRTNERILKVPGTSEASRQRGLPLQSCDAAADRPLVDVESQARKLSINSGLPLPISSFFLHTYLLGNRLLMNSFVDDTTPPLHIGA